MVVGELGEELDEGAVLKPVEEELPLETTDVEEVTSGELTVLKNQSK